MQRIVNLSGGKDSTAMLLLMIEKGERIDRVINVDMGVEFPEIQKHIEKLREYIKPLNLETYKIDFKYYLARAPVEVGNEIRFCGLGWPRWKARWCTGIKIATLQYAAMGGKNPEKIISNRRPDIRILPHVGIAADEKRKTLQHIRYPLIEWGVTSETALKICYERGFTFDGYYEQFRRSSCFCCPFTGSAELYKIYLNRPEIWMKIRNLDKIAHNNFTRKRSLSNIEMIFAGGGNIPRVDRYKSFLYVV